MVEMKARISGCIVLTRRRGGEEQVYLARRAKTLTFLGGFDVFPGGTEDVSDAPLADLLGCPKEFLIAAREMFEETGVLVLCYADADVRDIDFDQARKNLLAGDVSLWLSLAKRCQLPEFVDLGLWVTPPYLPVVYKARYYGIAVRESASAVEPKIWPGELTRGYWHSASAALHAHRAGELFLSYPVLETLRAFVEWGSMSAAQKPLRERDRTYPTGGGELLRGVQICPVRTFTLPPATHTNCYVLGGMELVVVDPATPIPEEQDRLIAYIELLLNEGRTLREIWLTHHHADHVGAAARLSDHFGVPIAAHEETALRLPELRIARFICDGDMVELPFVEGGSARWQALHTPGHAPGHLCFFEHRLGTLLSGDNVLGMGTVLIAPPDGHMGTYLQSLRRMREYASGFVLGAHGPPIATGVDRINFYLKHRTKREEAIFHHVPKSGWVDIEALVPLAYTDVDPRAFPLAALNVQAHLEHLVEQGRIVLREPGGVQADSACRRA